MNAHILVPPLTPTQKKNIKCPKHNTVRSTGPKRARPDRPPTVHSIVEVRMRHPIRKVSWTLICISALLLGAVAFAQGQWEGTPEYEALVEAAVAEGSLTLYTSGSEAAMAELGRDFQREFGITVNMLRLPSGALNARYGTEMESGVAQVDVYNAATIDLYELHTEWWQPITAELVPSSAD